MTTHRIRLYHSTQGAQSYHPLLDQWLTNMTPWEYPEVDNDLPAERDPIDGDAAAYYGADLAFDWQAEDKAIILDQLSQYAEAYCDWHRIGYHVCDHDAAEPTPCSWETTCEAGTVPDHIPDL